jgi:hypothetical protein
MADAPVVHIGENSPEHIAFKLMLFIQSADDSIVSKTEKKSILDLYAECLNAVQRPDLRIPRAPALR